MIGLGWVEPARRSTRSRTRRTSLDACLHPSFDPTRKYTMPWQAGITGIAYNTEADRSRARRASTTCSTAEYKGKVAMLTEMRDTVGLYMLGDGQRPVEARRTPRHEQGARQDREGDERRPGPPVHRQRVPAATSTNGNFVGLRGLVRRRRAAQPTNPDVRFVDPRGGRHELVRHHGDPEATRRTRRRREAGSTTSTTRCNAAQITAYVQYISPVKGVEEELIKMGGDAGSLADSPLLFPDGRDARSGCTSSPTSPDDVDEAVHRHALQRDHGTADVAEADAGRRPGAAQGHASRPYVLLAPGMLWLYPVLPRPDVVRCSRSRCRRSRTRCCPTTTSTGSGRTSPTRSTASRPS